MKYTKELPQIRDIERLAIRIRNFPITGLGIVQSAEHIGCTDEIIDFLKLFSERIVFKSRAEFVNYCGLLSGLLYEESPAEPELLVV